MGVHPLWKSSESNFLNCNKEMFSTPTLDLTSTYDIVYRFVQYILSVTLRRFFFNFLFAIQNCVLV